VANFKLQPRSASDNIFGFGHRLIQVDPEVLQAVIA